MKRWNGWGDESITYALSEDALAFLRERLGPGSRMRRRHLRRRLRAGAALRAWRRIR